MIKLYFFLVENKIIFERQNAISHFHVTLMIHILNPFNLMDPFGIHFLTQTRSSLIYDKYINLSIEALIYRLDYL